MARAPREMMVMIGMRSITVLSCFLLSRSIAFADDETFGESPVAHSHFSLGLGLGRVVRAGDSPNGTDYVWSVQYGARIATHFIIGGTAVGTGSIASPVRKDQFRAFLLTVRYTPWADTIALPGPRTSLFRLFDPRSVFVQLEAGAMVRFRTVFDSEDDSSTRLRPVVGLSLGWLPYQGRDYALGFSLRADVARFDGEEVATMQMQLVAQLGSVRPF